MTRPLVFVLLLSLSGCLGSGTAPPPAVVVYDVSPGALARDYPTALSYANCTVRVRLPAGTYSAEGTDIRVPGGIPFTPPLLVFRCRETPPKTGDLVCVGRVLPIVKDGFWRTVRADFCVVVTDCAVTRLSADHP
jgi:hypothetical protein